jgi:hypothetical protein
MTSCAVPIRPITREPGYHWFAYYDKLQIDPSGRYVLGMRVDFEHRSPRGDDEIVVGMVDLADGDRWIDLGTSRAWSWQQGCMLQWLPGSRDEVIWNDRQGERFVAHVLNVRSGAQRTIPAPIYAIAPDGRSAVAPDFCRINDTRPGYGYAGLVDPYRDELAPEGSGIWRVDLATGITDLIITLAQIAAIPYPRGDYSGYKHWFNHLLFNTDGSRFEFLHRWRHPRGFDTRMFTAAPDGSDIRVVDDYGQTSHFIWRDPEHILAWAWHSSHGERFYLYRDGARDVEVVGEQVMTGNGHCSYLPGNEWILNDTYPDEARRQHLYLYHVPTGTRVPLGAFPTPQEYVGEWRCDLHPRFSPDGKSVVIDSVHGGRGRQMYLLDISGVVARPPSVLG